MNKILINTSNMFTVSMHRNLEITICNPHDNKWIEGLDPSANNYGEYKSYFIYDVKSFNFYNI